MFQNIRYIISNFSWTSCNQFEIITSLLSHIGVDGFFLFLIQLCQEKYKWYQHPHQSLFKTKYFVIIEVLLN